jgi:hypothetical protein
MGSDNRATRRGRPEIANAEGVVWINVAGNEEDPVCLDCERDSGRMTVVGRAAAGHDVYGCYWCVMGIDPPDEEGAGGVAGGGWRVAIVKGIA